MGTHLTRIATPAVRGLPVAWSVSRCSGRDPHKPNRLILLLWLGAASLTLGLITAGVGMLMAGLAA